MARPTTEIERFETLCRLVRELEGEDPMPRTRLVALLEAELGLSSATSAYHWLDRIETELGIVVERGKKGYRVLDHAGSRKILSLVMDAALDREERFLLLFALSQSAHFNIPFFDRARESLLSRLEALSPGDEFTSGYPLFGGALLRPSGSGADSLNKGPDSLASQLQRIFCAPSSGAKDYSKSSATFPILMSAIAAGHRVRVNGYVAGNGDKVDPFILCPLKLFFRERGIYLFGLREDQPAEAPIKVYALERFGSARELAETFEYPAGFDADATLSSMFSVYIGEPRIVQIAFYESVAVHVRDRLHGLEIVEPETEADESGEGWRRLAFRAAGEDDIVRWVVGFGGKVRIEGPREHCEKLNQEADNW
jgi:predicted DNA-binding transcriptional regulator YafY